jgi:phage shock protein A
MKELLEEKEKLENQIWAIEMQDSISKEDWEYLKKFQERIAEIEKQIEKLNEAREVLENGF